MRWKTALALPALGLAGVAFRDLTQKKHAILHNFPVVGHARYLLEEIGPELRPVLQPLPLDPVMAHTGLRSPVAFPDGSRCDWVLTNDGWRERSVRSLHGQRRLLH